MTWSNRELAEWLELNVSPLVNDGAKLRIDIICERLSYKESRARTSGEVLEEELPNPKPVEAAWEEANEIWKRLGSPMPCLHPDYLAARERLDRAISRAHGDRL